jgi:acetyl esterase/lipase
VASAESKKLEEAYAQLSSISRAHPDLPLEAVRSLMSTTMSSVGAEPEGVTYAEVSADGVPALWCLPAEHARDRAILYTHGGGFIGGSPESHRKLTGHLARAAGVSVLSIDYALAPERAYPAAVDDAVTAYRWLRGQGFAAAHIATAGDSAGGGLCTSVVLRLRELGDELPAAVMPLSPWYDLELTGDTMVASRGTGDAVSIDALEQMRAAYLQGGADPSDPVANPMRADLAGFPPVLLHVGSAETLVCDSRNFAERAEAAGVDVTLVVEPEMLHVFPFGAGRMPEADAAVARMAGWVRPKLGL